MLYLKLIPCFPLLKLFEQGFDLNEWTMAMKDAFVAAAREVLPGGLSHDVSPTGIGVNITKYQENLLHQPVYLDHRAFSQDRTGQSATCFESLTVPALSDMEFFRDPIDANMFKQWVSEAYSGCMLCALSARDLRSATGICTGTFGTSRHQSVHQGELEGSFSTAERSSTVEHFGNGRDYAL